MMFNPSARLKRSVAAGLAAGVIGAAAVGGVAAVVGGKSTPPAPKTAIGVKPVTQQHP